METRRKSRLLLNYSHLQNTLGYIGLALPIVLIMYSWAYLGQSVEASVSAYYHTHMGDYFVASGCLLGVILLFYKGHNPAPILQHSPKFWQRVPDRWISLPAGISAIVVALVPINTGSCSWLTPELRQSITEQFGQTTFHCADSGIVHTVDIVHYVAAGLFLTCISFFCLFLFTRGNGTETHFATINGQKVTRLKLSPANVFFITCGIIILSSVVYLSFEQYGLHAESELKAWLADHRAFFWVEVVSIWTFAFAWLEQGRSNISPFRWITQR